MIRAGTVEEVTRDGGTWAFVDVGFSRRARSCGLAVDDRPPVALTFGALRRRLVELAARGDQGPLHLLMEAPLSAAFDGRGNPAPRRGERREGRTRYWYVGLGTSVLVAAGYLLRDLAESRPAREVRLFEGLMSFKPPGRPSSHTDDVAALRRVVGHHPSAAGYVIAADDLALEPDVTLESAFRPMGLDFGVPPVVVVGPVEG